ncbi:1,2-phenylacetyl-CoA epoxidase subunit B [Virgibacillus profundi]|uniref:1,2-phenylacetyl-CoA epoxidase subunit B n=1 Tax=Virgibacillus profundi TaxID=2024555 RepID=A0A2A2IC66_9BACI|nr:1,2-phenylacetyl-CoA epoxidase subunit PaaB [Virgibacillus profundi]PAV28906.1 1,2-phenylacetyl-CoA epoxidase subunit B [Virgibacillus profundi]PXY53074.1 1,2-phenylacetyl-CoA epoxidase subunit B [Virgibacillus profundi]
MTAQDESNFYKEYEVFSKRSTKAPIQHQFSLLAPNDELAMMMAQENFMRREDVIDVWVVPRAHIRSMTSEERSTWTKRLDNKSYRTTKGYGYLRKKWREKEQGMLDEKEIMSWKEVNKS